MCMAPKTEVRTPGTTGCESKICCIDIYFIDGAMVEGLGRNWCYTQLTPQSHSET